LSGPGVPESPHDYRWIVDNRTKRGIALDLRQPEGRAALGRLVERAGALVTNTPLDSRVWLGVRWEDLAPLNARLIYASVTAYGEGGLFPKGSRARRTRGAAGAGGWVLRAPPTLVPVTRGAVPTVGRCVVVVLGRKGSEDHPRLRRGTRPVIHWRVRE